MSILNNLSVNMITMKSFVLFAIAVLVLSSSVFALSYTNYVNDYANVIDAETESQLNAYIEFLEQNTSSELAVLTVDNIENAQSEKMYATQIFNEWGIGKAKADNGILVLVVMNTRRIEIEVGYGLEGILPDGKVGSIIRENADYFRAENYSQGIYNIVTTLGTEIQKEPFERDADSSLLNLIFPIIWVLFIFVLVISSIARGFIGNRCPKCKSKLTVKTTELKDEYVIEKKCNKCGYTKKERKKKSRFMFVPIIIGSGHGSSGGFGGFGGGGSGGGGAGGGW